MLLQRIGQSHAMRVSGSSWRHEWTLPLILFLFGVSAQAKYGGGTGEPNDPYRIFTAEQLNTIGTEPNDCSKHFQLMADIDLSGYSGEQFHVIGNQQKPFTGYFDGNGHALSNFSYRSSNKGPAGLFGNIGWFNVSTVIKNLELIDPNVEAANCNYVGSLVGLLRDAAVIDCRVSGGHVSGRDFVGGLIGGTGDMRMLSYFPRIKIIGCRAKTRVSGVTHVGGLIGSFGGASGLGSCRISACQGDGEVRGKEGVGGLAGSAGSIDITDCCSHAAVSGVHQVGGLLGLMEEGSARRCYAAGRVEGSRNVGGLLGASCSSVVKDCYWDTWKSSRAVSVGGLGKTTKQMKRKTTFLGWDFTQVWDIAENQTYPFLRPGASGDGAAGAVSSEPKNRAGR
jgi:hypothetical protein